MITVMNRILFPGLGVQVRDGEVRTLAFGSGKLLGPLAGAHAEVSEAGSVHAGRAVLNSMNPLVGPVGLYTGRRDSQAYIVFADGTLRQGVTGARGPRR
jgi:hypothetical protein